jgi:hypothetical protein
VGLYLFQIPVITTSLTFFSSLEHLGEKEFSGFSDPSIGELFLLANISLPSVVWYYVSWFLPIDLKYVGIYLEVTSELDVGFTT